MDDTNQRRPVPPTTVRRLSTYYRVLGAVLADGQSNVSSETLASMTGFTAAQVRRDLAYFGSFGKRGVGYAVSLLRQRLAAILGIDRGWRIGLVGVGNLGRALMAYPGFNNQGFDAVAAFDSDPAVIGSVVNGQRVRPIGNLAAAVRDEQIEMVIVTVPAEAAQQVVDQAIAAGVRAILNFAPTQLRVPSHVQLSSVDLAVEVEYLTYSLAE
ncbi:MAG: redox-sensing transcriptional repressor Rex [Chloroflexota bacterium]|nr:redox-sensing transcriptional repressor Rex [Chloroflexota bacterium]